MLGTGEVNVLLFLFLRKAYLSKHHNFFFCVCVFTRSSFGEYVRHVLYRLFIFTVHRFTYTVNISEANIWHNTAKYYDQQQNIIRLFWKVYVFKYINMYVPVKKYAPVVWLQTCVLLAWCRFELDTPVVWLHTCVCCWVYTLVVWLETCVRCWV